jgi:hypothetical protein
MVPAELQRYLYTKHVNGKENPVAFFKRVMNGRILKLI